MFENDSLVVIEDSDRLIHPVRGRIGRIIFNRDSNTALVQILNPTVPFSVFSHVNNQYLFTYDSLTEIKNTKLLMLIMKTNA